MWGLYKGKEEGMAAASDATTKFGHHYSKYHIHTGSQDDDATSTMTIGMGESEDGTAHTTLKTLLTDLPGSTQTVQEILANIKNTISDRHIAE